MDKNKDTIVEIYSGTLWESEMIKSLLENAEIMSFLRNAIGNNYAFDPAMFGGVKVMISSNDYLKAKEGVDEYCRNMNNDAP
jgi:hypothetical protein